MNPPKTICPDGPGCLNPPCVEARGVIACDGGPAALILDSELSALRSELEDLRAWKASALAVEREWDVQAMAKSLNGQIGQSCRKIIQAAVKEIPALRAQVAAGEKLAEALEDAADFIAALHEATTGAGQIDKHSIMRHGERLKTTAAKLDAKCKTAVALWTAAKNQTEPLCVFIPSENAPECYQCGKTREEHK